MQPGAGGSGERHKAGGRGPEGGGGVDEALHGGERPRERRTKREGRHLQQGRLGECRMDR
eukprot:262535-Prorocentrum_minimum.AAC.2